MEFTRVSDKEEALGPFILELVAGSCLPQNSEIRKRGLSQVKNYSIDKPIGWGISKGVSPTLWEKGAGIFWDQETLREPLPYPISMPAVSTFFSMLRSFLQNCMLKNTSF